MRANTAINHIFKGLLQVVIKHYAAAPILIYGVGFAGGLSASSTPTAGLSDCIIGVGDDIDVATGDDATFFVPFTISLFSG